MKCVCVRTCQAPLNDGKVGFFRKGEVFDFKKCPEYFEVVNSTERDIDLANISEAELRESKITKGVMETYMKEFHPSVSVPKSITRDNLIDKLLYARDNDENKDELNKLLPSEDEL